MRHIMVNIALILHIPSILPIAILMCLTSKTRIWMWSCMFIESVTSDRKQKLQSSFILLMAESANSSQSRSAE